jgi:hypothetical protein
VLARNLGLAKTADGIFWQINTTNMQTLLGKSELDYLVQRHTGACKTYSYYSHTVHTLALVYSWIYSIFLQQCYGPPTPILFKTAIEFFPMLSKFTYYLTEKVATALIHLDAKAGRDKDVFIHYDCDGLCASGLEEDGVVLACPDCMFPLRGEKCPKCARHFPLINGMLFLCDEAVANGYTKEASESIPKYHL